LNVLTASFPGASFKDVTGYRISACLTPGTGFQGNFYVYVSVQVDAQYLPGSVNLGTSGNPPKGPLQITGQMNASKKIDHTFDGITLITAEVGATRRKRLRLVEFQYPADVTDAEKKFQDKPPKLNNTWTREVAQGRLGDGYQFNIGGGDEHLLGFRSQQSANGRNLFRLASLGSKNSWLQKLLDFHKTGAAFNITVGRLSLPVDVSTVQRLYVEESFGDLLAFPPPPLAAVEQQETATSPENLIALGRFSLPDLSPAELLADEANNALYANNARQEVVQTATIVYRNPHHRDKQLP
jgi:hypothetical protein